MTHFSLHYSDDSILTPQQIAGVMDYIPTYEERSSLQSFISKGNDIETLCECEKFMVAIMSVHDAKKKLEAMLFKLRYPVALKELASGAFHNLTIKLYPEVFLI